MTRGTTPTHTFTLPFSVVNVKSCMVIYAQHDEEVLQKNTEDCELSGSTITVHLSQEDTLKFDQSANVQIQVRVLTTEDKAMASKVYIAPVGKCLNDEVIGDAD